MLTGWNAAIVMYVFRQFCESYDIEKTAGVEEIIQRARAVLKKNITLTQIILTKAQNIYEIAARKVLMEMDVYFPRFIGKKGYGNKLDFVWDEFLIPEGYQAIYFCDLGMFVEGTENESALLVEVDYFRSKLLEVVQKFCREQNVRWIPALEITNAELARKGIILAQTRANGGWNYELPFEGLDKDCFGGSFVQSKNMLRINLSKPCFQEMEAMLSQKSEKEVVDGAYYYLEDEDFEPRKNISLKSKVKAIRTWNVDISRRRM